MKLGGTKIAGVSLMLLAIQLALVSSIAAKYLYQRAHCPRVWTRALMYDPDLMMRGRYLSLQLMVDGCGSTLPSAKQAGFPRNVDGVPQSGKYSISIAAPGFVQFEATLAVRNNKLMAVRVPENEDIPSGLEVFAQSGTSCEAMQLMEPVNFYLAEHANSPLPLAKGQELWVEVTVPPKGPPRPIQLALKEPDGAWKPLAFQ